MSDHAKSSTMVALTMSLAIVVGVACGILGVILTDPLEPPKTPLGFPPPPEPVVVVTPNDDLPSPNPVDVQTTLKKPSASSFVVMHGEHLLLRSGALAWGATKDGLICATNSTIAEELYESDVTEQTFSLDALGGTISETGLQACVMAWAHHTWDDGGTSRRRDSPALAHANADHDVFELSIKSAELDRDENELVIEFQSIVEQLGSPEDKRRHRFASALRHGETTGGFRARIVLSWWKELSDEATPEALGWYLEEDDLIAITPSEVEGGDGEDQKLTEELVIELGSTIIPEFESFSLNVLCFGVREDLSSDDEDEQGYYGARLVGASYFVP